MIFRCSGVALCLLFFSALGQQVDENALFADTVSLVDSSKIINKGYSVGAAESTTVNFSGTVSSATELGAQREFFNGYQRKYLDPDAYIVGDLLLDVRLPFGVKAFGNVETDYYPDTGHANFYARELFVDANINHLVYFRTGKQVLQWGTCYFWNPTDLINVERKSFIDKLQAREGTYGIKMHIPFGTAFNIYSFLDLENPSAVDSISGAGKFEFLLGGTEIGAGVWGKPHRDPVFGLDLSSSIRKFNITAEASLTRGTNYSTLTFEDSTAALSNLGNAWFPRACAGVNRSFDFLDVQDRVTADVEFYYNQAGATGNIFKDNPLVRGMIDAIRSGNILAAANTQQTANLLYSVYEPNSYSKYYAALFTSVSEFLIPDITLSLNAIVNYDLKCAMLTTGLNYQTLHNFSLGLSVTSFIGPDYTEYTFSDQACLIRITAGVAF